MLPTQNIAKHQKSETLVLNLMMHSILTSVQQELYIPTRQVQTLLLYSLPTRIAVPLVASLSTYALPLLSSLLLPSLFS